MKPILSNNVLINLNNDGLISISGPDAEKFLQGQLTCNVSEINSTQSRLCALCNHQGRVLAVFILFYFQDSYYLQLPASILEQTLTHLKKYAVFSKVTLQVASNQLTRMVVSGPQISDLIKHVIATLPSNHFAAVSHDDYLVLQLPSASPSFEIIANLTIAKKIREQLNHLTEMNDNYWQLLKINAGIPTIYSETMGEFTPHMLNLPKLNAVSFDKGCYVGQEIVARTHYLGKSKRELYQGIIKLTDAPVPGAKLLNQSGQEVGSIIVAAIGAADECELLAVLSNDADHNDIYFQELKVTLLS